MPPRVDLTGKRFGKLVVIKVTTKKRRRYFWDCKCDCGSVVEVCVESLTKKKKPTKSCGCLRKEGRGNRTHGKYKSPEYNSWAAMKNRCSNPSNKKYKNYGGRGITVCERWVNSFSDFLIDMGEKPGSNYSIDRVDNDGDYTPENCVWATMKEQSQHKTTTRFIEYKGKIQSVSKWADELGVCDKRIRERLDRGWNVEDALVKPPANDTKTLTYKGKTKPFMEWVKITGINKNTLNHRLRFGWSVERAIETPVRKKKVKGK